MSREIRFIAALTSSLVRPRSNQSENKTARQHETSENCKKTTPTNGRCHNVYKCTY